MSVMPDLSPATLDPLRQKRGLLRVAIVLIAVALLVRLAWGWVVDSQFKNATASLAAAGEPITFEQLVSPPAPGDVSAWAVEQQAVAAIDQRVETPSESALEYRGYPPFPPEWIKLAAASEVANVSMFAFARQARSLPVGRTGGNDPNRTPPNVLIGRYVGARQLANHLGDGALYVHLQGDNAEAIERIRDILHLSRSAELEDSSSMMQILAIGMMGLATHRLNVIAPGLDLSRQSGSKAASTAQIQSLIGELLNEQISHDRAIAGFWSERAAAVEQLNADRRSGWMLRPLLIAEACRQQAVLTAGAIAMRKDNLVDALACLPPDSRGRSLPTIPRFSRWLDPNRSEPRIALRWHFSVYAERRMAAVGLAVQCFRAEYGTYPKSLEALVPKYLPAVPRDPYQADGRTIGFTIAKRGPAGDVDRPLLYTDPPGMNRPTLLPDEPFYSWWQEPNEVRQAGGTVRQYRDLSRWVPLRTKAIEDNP